MSKIIQKTLRECNINLKANQVIKYNFYDTVPHGIYFINNTNASIKVSDKIYVDTQPKILIEKQQQKSFVNPIGMREIYLQSDIDTTIFMQSFELEDISPYDLPEVQNVSIKQAISSDVNVVEISPIDIKSSVPIEVSKLPKVEIDNFPISYDVNVKNQIHALIDNLSVSGTIDSRVGTMSIKNQNISTVPSNYTISKDVKSFMLCLSDYDNSVSYSINNGETSFTLKGGMIYGIDELNLLNDLILQITCTGTKVLQIIEWR